MDSPAKQSPPIIESIVEQHAEEAAFLWLLRNAAISAPHYDLDDLSDLDNRVEAHIDGLRIAADPGWEICKGNLGEESGELFAAAVLALESGISSRIDDVRAAVEVAPETIRGFISAIGWVDTKRLKGIIKELLVSDSPIWKIAGIAGCAVHRTDPLNYLNDAAIHEDSGLRARAFRTIGEIKRKDLLPIVRAAIHSETDERVRFWACWASVMLGNRDAIPQLKKFVENDSVFALNAMSLVMQVSPFKDAQSWLKELAQHARNLRKVIIATGFAGYPQYIEWLIKQMDNAELARVAGESFSMITGVDIAYEDLEGEWPEDFKAGPTDNPDDEDVAMDPDEDLPWPNQELVRKWWGTKKSGVASGKRYLCGKPVSIDHCQHILQSGYQRQRIAAALEIALLNADLPLFETRAPGFRQQRLLIPLRNKA